MHASKNFFIHRKYTKNVVQTQIRVVELFIIITTYKVGKRIIVSERVLKSFLFEMAKERMSLNEIKSELAYDRFYKDKVPQDIYNTLMNGSPNMTPFHKLILDYIVQGKIKENIGLLVTLASTAWNKSELSSQYITNAVNSKLSVIEPENILGFLDSVCNQNGYSEKEYVDNGFVVLFENDRMIITATLNYASSQKHYGDSHWCTASDICGKYNGWKMFKRYSTYEGCVLVQFVDKNDRKETIQVAFDEDGKIDTACNFMDEPMSSREVKDYLAEYGIDFNTLNEIIDFPELIEETKAQVEDEDVYWRMKTEDYTNKAWNSANKIMNSDDYQKSMFDAAKWCYDNDFDEQEGSIFYVVPIRLYDNPNRFVFSVELRVFDTDVTEKVFGNNVASMLCRMVEDGDNRPSSQLYWTFLVDVSNGFNLIKKFKARYGQIIYNSLILTEASNTDSDKHCLIVNVNDGNIIFNGIVNGEQLIVNTNTLHDGVFSIGKWEWNSNYYRWQFMQSFICNGKTLEITPKVRCY